MSNPPIGFVRNSSHLFLAQLREVAGPVRVARLHRVATLLADVDCHELEVFYAESQRQMPLRIGEAVQGLLRQGQMKSS